MFEKIADTVSDNIVFSCKIIGFSVSSVLQNKNLYYLSACREVPNSILQKCTLEKYTYWD